MVEVASEAPAPDSTIPPSPDLYPIIVVEDASDIRALIQRVLASRGYTVHAYPTAENAFPAVRAATSPILVVDRMLPGMTGLDFIARVRELRDDFDAVLVTAFADVEALMQSLRLGVFRCVLKPFQNEDLLTAVAGAANRLWLRVELRKRTSELEARNRQLQKAVARLHDAEQRRTLDERLTSIGRLAAGVAHEINTPLAAVIANLALLGEELPQVAHTPDEEGLRQAEETLADARQAAERVRVIVRDLKTFSRGDDEKIGPVDLRRVIESTLNLVWNEIRHRARLVKDFGSTPHVRANEARLGQVVLNLLLNAAQAIPEGDAQNNEIRVVTRVAGGFVALEVRDTGPGIARDAREHLFEPFFTTKPIGLGTGLGLSICHGIVTALGGRIEVDSEEGHGATFRVLLPVATEQRLDPVSSIPVDAAPRGRVLAIDDDRLFLTTIARVLRKHCDLVAATSARDARELIAQTDFDAILCDLMMPEMTGMDLYAELASTAPAEAEKMIFLTGGTFTDRAQTFLDSVPNLRIEKPFDSKQLRVIINERVRRKLEAASNKGR
jgi:signal transduction histidine kinase